MLLADFSFNSLTLLAKWRGLSDLFLAAIFKLVTSHAHKTLTPADHAHAIILNNCLRLPTTPTNYANEPQMWSAGTDRIKGRECSYCPQFDTGDNIIRRVRERESEASSVAGRPQLLCTKCVVLYYSVVSPPRVMAASWHRERERGAAATSRV